MSSNEFEPGPMPQRTPISSRLRSESGIHEFNGHVGDHTIKVLYNIDGEPLHSSQAAPRLATDMPYTSDDSGELQQILPSEGQLMSAADIEAFERAAELEALAELQVKPRPVPDGQRQVSVRYSGPDNSHVDLNIVEGPEGRSIETFMLAFAGHAAQQGASYVPETYPGQYAQASQGLPEIESAPTFAPMLGAFSAPSTEQTHDTIEPSIAKPRALGEIEIKLRKALLKAVGIAAIGAGVVTGGAGIVWAYPKIGDVAYETSKQGVNGELISFEDVKLAFTGQEVTGEDKE